MTLTGYLKSRSLTTLDALVLLMGVWCLATLFSDLAASKPPPMQAEPSVIQISRGFPAWVNGLETFQTWADGASHYGAFAVADTGESGWVDEYNDPEIAAQSAVAYCQRYAETPCKVVAQSEPATPIGPQELPMSAETISRIAQNNARSGFRAFAIAEDGAWGSAWGYTTRIGARDSALAWCRKYLLERDEDLPEVTCRLVEPSLGGILRGL